MPYAVLEMITPPSWFACRRVASLFCFEGGGFDRHDIYWYSVLSKDSSGTITPTHKRLMVYAVHLLLCAVTSDSHQPTYVRRRTPQRRIFHPLSRLTTIKTPRLPLDTAISGNSLYLAP